jgi:hypothetical protein
MTSIQLILVVLSLLGAILGSAAFRSRLGLRLLAIFSFVTAAGFVLFPDSTTAIAHVLGVGRGTDLLLYLALFGGVNAFLLLYLRTRRLEEKLTEHIRAAAILNAHAPDSAPAPAAIRNDAGNQPADQPAGETQ